MFEAVRLMFVAAYLRLAGPSGVSRGSDGEGSHSPCRHVGGSFHTALSEFEQITRTLGVQITECDTAQVAVNLEV